MVLCVIPKKELVNAETYIKNCISICGGSPTQYEGANEVLSEKKFGCFKAHDPWANTHEKSMNFHNFQNACKYVNGC